MSEIAARLASIKARLAYAAKDSGRDPRSITLVAVSKTHDAGTIAPALAAGHRVFGENRVQEAAAKWPALRARYPDLKLHLIGPLQTNKMRDAVALFDAIETVDRDKLAQGARGRTGESAAAHRLLHPGEHRRGTAEGRHFSRRGRRLHRRCRDELKLPVAGLMCIPPAEEQSRAALRAARRDRPPRTADAAQHGHERRLRDRRPVWAATHVRIGTAIFGARPAAAAES